MRAGVGSPAGDGLRALSAAYMGCDATCFETLAKALEAIGGLALDVTGCTGCTGDSTTIIGSGTGAGDGSPSTRPAVIFSFTMAHRHFFISWIFFYYYDFYSSFDLTLFGLNDSLCVTPFGHAAGTQAFIHGHCSEQIITIVMAGIRRGACCHSTLQNYR